MGSTMLASETSTVPLGQTNSPRGSSGKLVAMIAGGIVIVGLIGIGAFFGLRGHSTGQTAGTSPDVVPVPLPSSMHEKPKEAPTVATVATDVPTPAATEMPSVTTSAIATAAPTLPATRSTTKSISTGSTKTKKSNDDDLMSGRK
jgi:hypothetical protein